MDPEVKKVLHELARIVGTLTSTMLLSRNDLDKVMDLRASAERCKNPDDIQRIAAEIGKHGRTFKIDLLSCHIVICQLKALEVKLSEQPTEDIEIKTKRIKLDLQRLEAELKTLSP